MVNGGNIFLNQKIFMNRIWENHKELFRYSKIYPEIYFIDVFVLIMIFSTINSQLSDILQSVNDYEKNIDC